MSLSMKVSQMFNNDWEHWSEDDRTMLLPASAVTDICSSLKVTVAGTTIKSITWFVRYMQGFVQR